MLIQPKFRAKLPDFLGHHTPRRQAPLKPVLRSRLDSVAPLPAAGPGRSAPGFGVVPGPTRVRTKICREKRIEYARRLLGHANISTTQRYMHLERELADAQDPVE